MPKPTPVAAPILPKISPRATITKLDVGYLVETTSLDEIGHKDAIAAMDMETAMKNVEEYFRG